MQCPNCQFADHVTTDPIVESVRTQMLVRSQIGINKYGTMMTRTDLNRVEWLKHAQQEAMDLAIYLERLIQDAGETNADQS